jgi:hypothetical protein
MVVQNIIRVTIRPSKTLMVKPLWKSTSGHVKNYWNHSPVRNVARQQKAMLSASLEAFHEKGQVG